MTRGNVLLVLFALAAGGCGDPDRRDPRECQREVENMLVISLPAEPPVELRVESCRRDVDACTQLCTFMLERGSGGTFVDACRVEFIADEVHLHASQGSCL